jgi:NAD(P)-dependent dehydrogenase (short-subunit alcohol dehydrogenase family)
MPRAHEHVLIIGGTAGIGLAIAKAACAIGCTVTIAGRNATTARDAAAALGPNASGIAVDLRSPHTVHDGLADGPPIDHLVITAIHRMSTNVRDFAIGEAEELARVKLVGYPAAVHAALPRLLPTSSIVLFGGVAKSLPYLGSTMVSTVNAGVVGLTRTLAVELAPIRVNCISPGLVPDTPHWEKLAKQGVKLPFADMIATTPARRLATTEDVVHATFFLMDNRAVDGIDLEIDGGIQLV